MITEGIDFLKPGVYELNPKNIRFTQSDVSPYFSNGARVDGLINQLKAGTISPKDLPPIQTVYYDGKLFALDNRRLLAYNTAGVAKVPTEVISLKDSEAAQKFFRKI